MGEAPTPGAGTHVPGILISLQGPVDKQNRCAAPQMAPTTECPDPGWTALTHMEPRDKDIVQLFSDIYEFKRLGLKS